MSHTSRLLTSATFLFLLIGISHPVRANSITIYDVPGSTFTFGHEINDAGQVAGYYLSAETGDLRQGFIREANGNFTLFGFGNFTVQADGINRQGFVSGSYGVSDVEHGFIRDPEGRFLTFDVPGSLITLPNGINSALEVSGSFMDTAGWHGFIREADGAFVTFNLPGSGGTFPGGINDLGQVTGTYVDVDSDLFIPNNIHSYVYDYHAGNFRTFDVPGSVGTFAESINDRGAVAGYVAINHRQAGFVRSADGTFATIDVPGAISTSALGINNAGDISGSFVDTSGVHHGYILTTVPEPASLTLLGCGLAAFLVRRRWKKE